MALQDSDIYGTLQFYRELEHARFLDLYKHKIHPELFDDFIGLIDSVFDVRIPPLFTVLHHFAKILEQPEENFDTVDENNPDNK